MPMGKTTTVKVVCDGLVVPELGALCGNEVSYPALAKDLEAEDWYSKHYRETGARSYEPKMFFCGLRCERTRQGNVR